SQKAGRARSKVLPSRFKVPSDFCLLISDLQTSFLESHAHKSADGKPAEVAFAEALRSPAFAEHAADGAIGAFDADEQRVLHLLLQGELETQGPDETVAGLAVIVPRVRVRTLLAVGADVQTTGNVPGNPRVLLEVTPPARAEFEVLHAKRERNTVRHEVAVDHEASRALHRTCRIADAKKEFLED